MVIVASIYLTFYVEVGVGTFLPTPNPPKIPSNSDSTALPNSVKICILNWLRQLSIKTFDMNLFLENGIALNNKYHTKINYEASQNVKLNINIQWYGCSSTKQPYNCILIFNSTTGDIKYIIYNLT
jgi:hypothetical protein